MRKTSRTAVACRHGLFSGNSRGMGENEQMPSRKTTVASKAPQESASRNGIQSIEVGAPLLAALARAEEGMQLTALAAAAGMPASKAHRYLTSFMRAGLMERDPANGIFSFGPLSRAIGLAVLRRQDVVRESGPVMELLRNELQENVALCVWDEGRPTVIKVEEHARALSVRVRVGARLPLLSSATGHVYLSWLSSNLTKPYAAQELKNEAAGLRRMGLRSEADIEKLKVKVRREGIATVADAVLEGLTATATPVFRYPDTLAASLTVVCIGKSHPQSQKEINERLRVAGAELSQRLGARVA
jgi:DNA-binding IclR family transcriptional regulator